MENLIGEDVLRVPELLMARDTAVHLYGKGAPRPGRKMGHANRVVRT
jgi:5-(carboxyamino)imidazole ribonucleotide synthase